MLNKDSLRQLVSQFESWKEYKPPLVVSWISAGETFSIVDNGNLSVTSVNDEKIQLVSASKKTTIFLKIGDIVSVSHVVPADIDINYYLKGGKRARHILCITTVAGILMVLEVVHISKPNMKTEM